MGGPPPEALSLKGHEMKVRNIGNRYIGPDVEAHAGEVVEVSDRVGAYLLSAECPGKFEAVEKPALARKAGK